TAELQQIDAARQQASGTDDQAWTGATDLLAQALGREDLQALYREAARTPTKADDQAIASIAAARAALQKTDGEGTRIRAEISEMARRRSELEGARDRARVDGYDDPRGTFGGSGGQIIGQVIGGILQGAIQGAMVDRTLRDHYRAPQRRADPDFGSRGDTPSWPNPWSGGGAGRGDTGGGGWRT